ncbi:gluconokinase [Neorhizobium galegae]|uniref:Gluconokinase n=1 Tax=Neorhizobium galegae bv. orientalis str. HAMBI 540 TaxID=1028800 RepID=A0A068SSJ5_NEOGA|nr:gluconokinase [Neorhizobium galegae]CDN48824.1 Thermoresistant gluconokinase [Neorhizobium galegae bv. orientalis str. HAMBI 540]
MLMAASPPASEAGGFGPIVVMGVSGCGKSSVGERLADYLGCGFIEGDGLHPPSNVRKMRMGTPLEDEDRWPWLDAFGHRLAGTGDIVVSCSALKRTYRDRLRSLSGRPMTFVFLQGDRMLLAARMAARKHEYMPLSLLDSQLATLELPTTEPDVATVDINQSLESIVSMAMTLLAARQRRSN